MPKIEDACYLKTDKDIYKEWIKFRTWKYYLKHQARLYLKYFSFSL